MPTTIIAITVNLTITTLISLLFLFPFSSVNGSTIKMVKEDLVPRHLRTNKRDTTIRTIRLENEIPLLTFEDLLLDSKGGNHNHLGMQFLSSPWYKINLALNENVEIVLNYTIPVMVNIVDGYCHHPLYVYINGIKSECYRHHALLSINPNPLEFDNPFDALTSGKCSSTIADGISFGNGLCSFQDPFTHKFNPVRLTMVYPKMKEFDGIIPPKKDKVTGKGGENNTLPLLSNSTSNSTSLSSPSSMIINKDKIKEGGHVFIQLAPYASYSCQMEWKGEKFSLVQPWYHSIDERNGMKPEEKCKILGMKLIEIKDETDIEEGFYQKLSKLIDTCPYLRESKRVIISKRMDGEIIGNCLLIGADGKITNIKGSTAMGENSIQDKKYNKNQDNAYDYDYEENDNARPDKQCNRLKLPSLCKIIN